MSDFSAQFFANNRKRLLEQVDAELIVIPANCTLQRTGDSSYPFRQDSNFWYLTGVDEPDCVLVMSSRQTYIITPTRSRVQTIFDGAVDMRAMQKRAGVDEVLTYREGWQKLKRQLKPEKKVGFPLPSTHMARAHSLALNPARKLVLSKLRRFRSNIEIVDTRFAFASLRSVKQAEEIEAIQKAINITNDTLREVFASNWYKTLHYEYEVEAQITAGFQKRGARSHGYTPIVARDENATTLHYVANDAELRKGGLLLVDAGAEYSNYTADITRVIPVGAKLSARQKEIVKAVEEVQQFALGLLKPGVLMKEYEQAVEARMGEVLKRLKLISRVNRKNIRKLYPHAASHMLGLDAHDAADYTQPLQENMVLTVEPGIYISKEKIGIRIEDDVVLTKDGVKSLSSNLPPVLGGTTI